MKFSAIFALLLTLLFTPHNFVHAQTADALKADITGSDTISAGRDVPADRDIARRIQGIFAEIGTLQKVRVTVSSGVVTLRGGVPDQTAIDQAEILAGRVEGVVAVANLLQEETSVSQRIVPIMERLVERALQGVNYLPLLSVALLVFIIISVIGWWLAARNWLFERLAPNAFISGLLRQIVRLVFLGLGLVLALDIMGASALIGTILGAAGIVGLAVGFAVRDTVENYIASILLSLRQPFRPNDFVDIAGHQGRVILLTSRATVLLSMDGNHIRIPNSTVFKSVIINYTRHPERRFGFEIGVSPNCDLQEAVETGLEVLNELDFVLKKPLPEGWIHGFGDSTMQLWFAGWINQRETSLKRAQGQAIRLIKLRFEEAGIEMPEPGMRITMLGSEPTGAVPAKPVRPKIIIDDDVEDADIAVQVDVEAFVVEEREQMKDQDLLKDDGPQEVG